MPRHRTRTLVAATLLLLSTAACSASTPKQETPPQPTPAQPTPTQHAEASLVAYWNEHPGQAPALTNTTALLDEQYTGSHVFTLPATTDYSTLVEGVACEDPTVATDAASSTTSTDPSSSPAGTSPRARRWSVGFGDEQGVWPTQIDSECAGLGGGLGTIQTAQFGAPTRVYVTVDHDTSYSLGVWGELAADTTTTPPSPESAASIP